MFYSISGDGKSGNLDKSTGVMARKKPDPDYQLMWVEINQKNKSAKQQANFNEWLTSTMSYLHQLPNFLLK